MPLVVRPEEVLRHRAHLAEVVIPHGVVVVVASLAAAAEVVSANSNLKIINQIFCIACSSNSSCRDTMHGVSRAAVFETIVLNYKFRKGRYSKAVRNSPPIEGEGLGMGWYK